MRPRLHVDEELHQYVIGMRYFSSFFQVSALRPRYPIGIFCYGNILKIIIRIRSAFYSGVVLLGGFVFFLELTRISPSRNWRYLRFKNRRVEFFTRRKIPYF